MRVQAHIQAPTVLLRSAQVFKASWAGWQKVGEIGEISPEVSELWNAILIRTAEIMPFYSGTHLTRSRYSHSVNKLHDNYIY